MENVSQLLARKTSKPTWRNWQTRWTKDPVSFGLESSTLSVGTTPLAYTPRRCYTAFAMLRRTKIEMQKLDEKIRPLYERGVGCRVIGQVLDINPATVLKRVRRMGIDRSRGEAQEVVQNSGFLFSQEPQDENLRRSAIGGAIQWFMERGYSVSVPVEPVKYDLITESDEGLKRVQIKTTIRVKRKGWSCKLSTLAYDKDAKTVNANGKRKRKTYTSDEVDLFFIETGDREAYLIPLYVVEGLTEIALDRKYKKFKVS